MKEITIVHPKDAAKRFEKQTFRSYLAVAKAIPPSATVMVRVADVGKPTKKRADAYADPNPLSILLGFGEVSGIQNGRYTVPRMLRLEY